MDVSLYDSVRLLDRVRASTRITWLVLATLRRTDNVVPYPADVLEATTGLGRHAIAHALAQLVDLGLIEHEPDGIRLLTTFGATVPRQAELRLDAPAAVLPQGPPIHVTTPDDLVLAWNTYAPALHPIRKLTPDRRRRAWARITQNPDVDWSALCARLNASRFCRGDNSSGWRAGFDFLLRGSTVQKTLEGIYDDRPLSPVSLGNATAAAAWLSARKRHA